MFRVIVFAAEVKVRNQRFESRDCAEKYFEEQADSFFNDFGVHVDLEERRKDGRWITLRTAAGRRNPFPSTEEICVGRERGE